MNIFSKKNYKNLIYFLIVLIFSMLIIGNYNLKFNVIEGLDPPPTLDGSTKRITDDYTKNEDMNEKVEKEVDAHVKDSKSKNPDLSPEKCCSFLTVDTSQAKLTSASSLATNPTQEDAPYAANGELAKTCSMNYPNLKAYCDGTASSPY